jgi:hypothetical protein
MEHSRRRSRCEACEPARHERCEQAKRGGSQESQRGHAFFRTCRDSLGGVSRGSSSWRAERLLLRRGLQRRRPAAWARLHGDPGRNEQTRLALRAAPDHHRGSRSERGRGQLWAESIKDVPPSLVDVRIRMHRVVRRRLDDSDAARAGLALGTFWHRVLRHARMRAHRPTTRRPSRTNGSMRWRRSERTNPSTRPGQVQIAPRAQPPESLRRPAEIEERAGRYFAAFPSGLGDELRGLRLECLRAVRAAEVVRLAVVLGVRRVVLDDELVARDEALGTIPDLGFARRDQGARRRAGAGGGRAGGGRRRRRGASARDGEEGAEEEHALDSHAPECTCLPPTARGKVRTIGESARPSEVTNPAARRARASAGRGGGPLATPTSASQASVRCSTAAVASSSTAMGRSRSRPDQRRTCRSGAPTAALPVTRADRVLQPLLCPSLARIGCSNRCSARHSRGRGFACDR